MKRGKKLIALFCVLIVLTGATFAAKLITPKEDTSETTTDAIKFTILTIESEMVDSLSLTYDNETLNFTYSEDTWSYADDATFPLDASYISSMLSSISNIEASKMIEDVEDFSQYGLDEPICKISVGYGSGYELLIGDTTAVDGLRYFSIGDGNVYLVDESILSAFSYGLYDLLQTESLPDMSDIVSVSITSETQSLFIEQLTDSGLAYSNDYVWFLKENNDYLTLDTELTDALISNITALALSNCSDYYAEDDELASYGLTEPMVTATIIYTDEEEEKSFSLELGSYLDSYCYARIADSRMVYLIDATVSDTLMYTDYDKLQPDDVLLMDWNTVTSTDIIIDNTEYQIFKTSKSETDDAGNVTEEIIYTLNDAEIAFEDIQTLLTVLTSTGYSNGTLPERSAEISFTFHRGTDTFPEVELTFYQYDSTSCLVSLNGKTTVFVAREDVTAIKEAVESLVAD